MKVLIKPGDKEFLAKILCQSGRDMSKFGSSDLKCLVESIEFDLDTSLVVFKASFNKILSQQDFKKIQQVLSPDFKDIRKIMFEPDFKLALKRAEVSISDSSNIDSSNTDLSKVQLKDKSQTLKDKSQTLKDKSQTLKDKSKTLRCDKIHVECTLNQYWPVIIQRAKKQHGNINGWLTDPSWQVDEGCTKLDIKVHDQLSAEKLDKIGCSKVFSDVLEEMSGCRLNVAFSKCEKKAEQFKAQYECKPGNDDLPDMETILKATRESQLEADKGGGPVSGFKKNGFDNSGSGQGTGFKGGYKGKGKGKGRRGDAVFKKQITLRHKPIRLLNSSDLDSTVAIKGRLFNIETKEIRSGSIIVTLFITDESDSVQAKFFMSKAANEELKKFSINDWVIAEGVFVHDDFIHDELLELKAIVKIENESDNLERIDSAKAKRVELHCHSNLSDLDAITPIKDLVAAAAKWGHSSIAITDHGVLQGYPELAASAKKYGIKPIFGVEAYLINDSVNVMTPGPKGLPTGKIDETSFVVFDLETTALNPVAGQIIEIGACRVKGGEILDTFSTFAACDKAIPQEIVNLTGIQDSMLKGAPSEIEAIRAFVEYAGPDTLVAHNAFNFDVNFINKRILKLGDEPILNPVIDTLPLSQAINTDIATHNLKRLVRYFKVVLENHHRALDDAIATAHIFNIFLKKMEDDPEIDTSDVSNIARVAKNIDIKTLRPFHCLILVKTQKGLRNLYELVSESHLNYFYKKPRIPKSLLADLREGLIIGTACEAGELFQGVLQGKKEDELSKIAEFYDFLEIQPVGNNAFLVANGQVATEENLRHMNKAIFNLGHSMDKPVVATSDAHYLDTSHEVYRKILLAGKKFKDADKEMGLHLKTTNEMLSEFSYLGEEGAHEVVVTNTNAIADSIDMIKPVPDGLYPPKLDGADDEIRELTYIKAKELYGEDLPEIIKERVERELNSIIGNGYAVLYLIAQKLVKKSNDDGYLVGSRGSVGSSVVAYFSGITEVNAFPPHYRCSKCKQVEFITDGSYASGADLPAKDCPKCKIPYLRDGFEIPFEVFMGFHGDKVPDIDLNFSGKYQSKIHKYTEELFGSDHVFKAGTIATVQEKTAIGFVKSYFEMTNQVKRTAEVKRLATGCTGVKRTTGQHPGGLMVVPQDKCIYDFCPIQRPANKVNSDVITTHFDYHSIHDNLVKLDLLGHDDPTVIRMLEDFTGVNAQTIHLGDEDTLSLFTSPKALGVNLDNIGCETGTLGIPEFGTPFVRQMLMDTQPKTFGELVLISGLSHGTNVWLGNAQEFIKQGEATLKEVVAVRDDIMTFLILKGLDKSLSFRIMEFVRKGKGAKNKEQMEEYAQEMKKKDVPEWYIESCRRISYMFPKAHAVAYVMMAFRIAWFKINYPEAFYATYFSTKGDAFDADIICAGQGEVIKNLRALEEKGNNATTLEKNQITIFEIAYEMFQRGVKVLPVTIFESMPTDFILKDKALIPPLCSLKGLGETVAENIVRVRQEKEFKSQEDLRLSCGINKTVMETLLNHGCLEGMPETAQMTLF